MDKTTIIIEVFFHGHIDCMGPPFAAVMMDILNPPWLHGPRNIPMSAYVVDAFTLDRMFPDNPMITRDEIDSEYTELMNSRLEDE